MPVEQFELDADQQRRFQEAWEQATSSGDISQDRARAVATLLLKDEFGITRTDTAFDAVMTQVLSERGFTHKKMEHPEPRLSLAVDTQEEATGRMTISPLMAVLLAVVFFGVGVGGAIAWKNGTSGPKVAQSSDVEESSSVPTDSPEESAADEDPDTSETDVESPPVSQVSREADAQGEDKRLEELLAGDMKFVTKLSPSEVRLLASTASSEPSSQVDAALLLYADRVRAKAIGKGDFPALLKLFADLQWIAAHAPDGTFNGKDVLALDRYSRLMLAGRDPEDPSKAVDGGGTLSAEEWDQAKTAIEKALNTTQ